MISQYILIKHIYFQILFEDRFLLEIQSAFKDTRLDYASYTFKKLPIGSLLLEPDSFGYTLQLNK